MQREELELQRDELRLTREELAKSAQAQELLVKYSKEDLELQRLIRKNQIKPELKLKICVILDNNGKDQIYLSFISKRNILIPTNFLLAENKFGLIINEEYLFENIDKHIDNVESFEVHIINESHNYSHVGFKLTILYNDIDSNQYEESIIVDDFETYEY